MPRARVAAIVMAILVLGWVAASGALWYQTADFYCLREGARLTASGQDPYDESLWRSVVTTVVPDPIRGSGTPTCVARYASPLWTAVVMLPFGVLPLELSASLWMALSIGSSIAGTRWIWHGLGGSASLAPVFAVLVVTSQPFWLLLVGGQITGVLLGLLGVGVWLSARGRPGLSGAALGALIVKPQVAGLFLPVYVLREILAGRARTAIGASMAVVALIAASLAVQPGWIPQWLDEVSGRRLGYVGLLPTAWGLSNDLLGTVLLAPLLIAGAVASAAILVWGRSIGGLTFAAIAIALALFAAPHIWSYDFLVLALPWGAALVIADLLPGHRRTLGVGLAVATASIVPWAFYAVGLTRGQENLSALVPVIAAIAVAAVVRMQPTSVTPTP